MKKLAIFSLVFLYQTISYAQLSWNNALKLKGDSYLEMGSSSKNCLSANFTVQVWIKPTASALLQSTIVGNTNFRLMLENGKLRMQFNNSTLFYSTSLLTANKWQQITMVGNSAHISLYLNGVLDSTSGTYYPTFSTTSDSLIFGKSIYTSALFTGLIDDFRIWSTALEPTAVQQTYQLHYGWYNPPYAVLKNVITFEFDVETPMNQVYLPYGGECHNCEVEQLGMLSSCPVISNSAIVFPSVTSKVVGPSNPDIDFTGPFTAEAWVWVDNLGIEQNILSKGSAYQIAISPTGQIKFVIGGNVGMTTEIVQPKRWYHIALVGAIPSGATQLGSLYLNGRFLNAFNFSMVSSTGTDLVLGGDLVGAIDEVKLSNFAKNITEIQKSMFQSVTYFSRPEAPYSSVVYNFDGNTYSGTRLGPPLTLVGSTKFLNPKDNGNPISPIIANSFQDGRLFDSFQYVIREKRIPEYGTAGFATDSLYISSDTVITDLNVFVSLEHQDLTDVNLTLISPAKESKDIFIGDSGSDNPAGLNGMTTILDNQSIDTLTNSSPQFGYSTRNGSTLNLDAFNGTRSKGWWKLKITDLNNGKIGTLQAWGVKISGDAFVNSLDDKTIDSGVKIYPNPTSGIVKIESSNFVVHNFELLNNIGQTLHVGGEKNSFDLSNFESGVYFVKIYSSENEIKLIKLIKE